MLLLTTIRAGRLRLALSGGEGGDPIAPYFSKDKQGRTIFDYEMIGSTPENAPPANTIDTSTDTIADPNAKSTLEAGLEDTLKRQDDLQRYFTGRKVENDCPTYPYCNHIPAPPPVTPPPTDISAPNANIWYPWLPQNPSSVPAPPAVGMNVFNPSSATAKNRPNVGGPLEEQTFHPWYNHRDIGQKWKHDPIWELPFEKPGVVPRRYNRLFQRHMYDHGIGDLASSPKTGPKVEAPPNGPYVESEAAEAEAASQDLSTSKEGISKTYESAPVRKKSGPGGRPAAGPATTGYQPPNRANEAWDGLDLEDGDGQQSPAPGADSSALAGASGKVGGLLG